MSLKGKQIRIHGGDVQDHVTHPLRALNCRQFATDNVVYKVFSDTKHSDGSICYVIEDMQFVIFEKPYGQYYLQAIHGLTSQSAYIFPLVPVTISTVE